VARRHSIIDDAVFRSVSSTVELRQAVGEFSGGRPPLQPTKDAYLLHVHPLQQTLALRFHLEDVAQCASTEVFEHRRMIVEKAVLTLLARDPALKSWSVDQALVSFASAVAISSIEIIWFITRRHPIGVPHKGDS